MTALFIGFTAIQLIALVALMWHIRKAPMGHENSTGFHEDKS